MIPMRSKLGVCGLQITGRLGSLLVLLSLAMATAQGKHTDRQVTTVDLPGAMILAMNNRGDVTGYYCDQGMQPCGPTSSNARGFVRESNGTIATFQGTPRAINDAGTVAGSFQGPQVSGGFIRTRHGVITTFDFGVPFVNDCGTSFMAINSREEVAGFYSACSAVGIVHTFVAVRSKNGYVTKFEIPGDMIPTAINGHGDLVAYFQGSDTRGFLVTRRGTVTLLLPGPPGQPLLSFPVAINNSGDVAGYFGGSDGRRHGFIRDKEGTYTIFNGQPAAMNERGDVVGSDLAGGSFFRDARSGAISTITCQGVVITTMNDRGDVAGGNAICEIR